MCRLTTVGTLLSLLFNSYTHVAVFLTGHVHKQARRESCVSDGICQGLGHRGIIPGAMDDKRLTELAHAVVDCLKQINDMRLRWQVLDHALHTSDDASLYLRYMAELESLRKSTANVTNITSIEALRTRIAD
jgi:hypothetical protein